MALLRSRDAHGQPVTRWAPMQLGGPSGQSTEAKLRQREGDNLPEPTQLGTSTAGMGPQVPKPQPMTALRGSERGEPEDRGSGRSHPSEVKSPEYRQISPCR